MDRRRRAWEGDVRQPQLSGVLLLLGDDGGGGGVHRHVGQEDGGDRPQVQDEVAPGGAVADPDDAVGDDHRPRLAHDGRALLPLAVASLLSPHPHLAALDGQPPQPRIVQEEATEIFSGRTMQLVINNQASACCTQTRMEAGGVGVENGGANGVGTLDRSQKI